MRNLGASSILPKGYYNQYWIFVIYESPIHTYNVGFPKYRYAFNKTFTYETDSDFYDPYGHVVPKHNIRSIVMPPDARNRTKLILWYVSNCAYMFQWIYIAYMADVQKLIIAEKPKATKLKYKFYLAFESGRCKDYITEKIESFV